jgi:hypothetical protein
MSNPAPHKNFAMSRWDRPSPWYVTPDFSTLSTHCRFLITFGTCTKSKGLVLMSDSDVRYMQSAYWCTAYTHTHHAGRSVAQSPTVTILMGVLMSSVATIVYGVSVSPLILIRAPVVMTNSLPMYLEPNQSEKIDTVGRCGI